MENDSVINRLSDSQPSNLPNGHMDNSHDLINSSSNIVSNVNEREGSLSSSLSPTKYKTLNDIYNWTFALIVVDPILVEEVS